MSTQILFPVFLLEKDSGEVTKFSSLAEMQKQLEKIDIENQEYEAWDRSGSLLKLTVQDPLWLNLQPQGAGSGPPHLREALMAYASSVGANIKMEGAADAAFDVAFEQIQKVKRTR